MRPLTEIIDELDAIESIPEFLESRGVTGELGDCNACPLATYIQRETGADLVKVVADYTEIEFAEAGVTLSEDHPFSVTHFIVEFDLGFYPQLDRATLEV